MSIDNILLVEDDAAIAEPLIYALKRENWTVNWFTTAQAGLAHLKQSPIDFIILDVGLPDMDGFELCRLIRKQFDTPLVFLTARNEEIERIIGLEIGADDYCSKPFSPRELISRIKVIWRRYQPNNSADSPDKPQECHSPNWYYDQARQQIYYYNQQLNLTPIELRLLLAFLKHPNHILSREQLMQAAWDYPEHSLARTVDSHIKSLRQKLKNIHPDDPILTHRGFGYEMSI